MASVGRFAILIAADDRFVVLDVPPMVTALDVLPSPISVVPLLLVFICVVPLTNIPPPEERSAVVRISPEARMLLLLVIVTLVPACGVPIVSMLAAVYVVADDAVKNWLFRLSIDVLATVPDDVVSVQCKLGME